MRRWMHRGELLSFEEIAPQAQASPAAAPAPPAGPALELDVVVALHIRRVLELAGGKIHGPGGAGELLRINPNTLRYKMRKLGIPFRRQRADAVTKRV
jgi:hypothetical protein